MIYKILDDITKTQGTNAKIALLKQHKDNQLLKRVFSMALDKVKYSYGIRKFPNVSPATNPSYTLENALDFLELQLATRNITGNSAISALGLVLQKLSQNDFLAIKRVIERDLKCGLGKTHTNSVWSGLIVKPPYMRCATFTSQTSRRISYPAFVQLKCDGRYVSITVDSGDVTFTSRSGEEQEFPELAKIFSKFTDGVYMGELLVDGEDDRAIANGLINSSEPPHDKIRCILWDSVSLSEFTNGSSVPYNVRLYALEAIVGHPSKVSVVEYHTVNSKDEALQKVTQWTSKGLEGGVLKDFKLPFKNHTSPLQLKIKLKCDITVKCIGFTEGTIGTSRENTFGAMVFETDDGMIQGQTSGFKDSELQDFNSRRKEIIGTYFDVEFNDISKARDSDTYALSHPRFIGLRPDRTESDTLERTLEIIKMARGL